MAIAAAGAGPNVTRTGGSRAPRGADGAERRRALRVSPDRIARDLERIRRQPDAAVPPHLSLTAVVNASHNDRDGCNTDPVDFMAAYSAVKPLYEQASKKLPASAAMRVSVYCVTYRWYFDQHGKPPTREEHAEAMDVSRSTIARYRRDFKHAFGVDSPLDLPAALVPSVPTLPMVLKIA